MGFAAHLTGDVHLGLVGVESGGEFVMFNGKNVGPAVGEDAQNLHKAARLVQQPRREADAAVARGKIAKGRGAAQAEPEVAE